MDHITLWTDVQMVSKTGNLTREFKSGNSVLFADLAGKIAASIANGYAQDDSRCYLIRSVPGGGKSHFIRLLKLKLEKNDRDFKILPVILDHDYSAAISEREICRSAARQTGFSGGGGSLDSLNNLLRESGERMALLLENPRKIFGEAYADLIGIAAMNGISTVIVSDDIAEHPPGDFKEIYLPAFYMNDVRKMLNKRKIPEDVIGPVTEIFNSIKFLPVTPQNTHELASACLLAGSKITPEELFYRFLDGKTSGYKYICSTISPQRKSILMAVAESSNLLSPAEIAANTGISLPVVNTQIKRLRDAGILQEVQSGKGRQSLHYPADPVFTCWVKSRTMPEFIPSIKLALKWREYRRFDDTPQNSFVRYMREGILGDFKFSEEVRFLLDSEAFPLYPFETLTKTFISYIRGGDLRRAEAAMEIEGERSIDVGKNKKAARAKLLAGVARLILGNVEGAKTTFKESASRGEDHPLLFINLGAVFYREGNNFNARNNFLQAVKAADKFPEAFCGLAAVLRNGGDLNQAEEYFSRALKLNDKFVPALTGLANVNYAWKKYDLALNLLKGALDIENTNVICLRAAADISFTVSKFAQCAEWSLKLIDVSPGDNNEMLYTAACLAETLVQVNNNNFGLAEKAFFEMADHGFSYSAEVHEDILITFILALISAGRLEFCLKALDLLEENYGGELSGIMEHLKMIIGIVNDPVKPERLFRMPPEERELIEVIKKEAGKLNTGSTK